jgi:hypothetical protein
MLASPELPGLSLGPGAQGDAGVIGVTTTDHVDAGSPQVGDELLLEIPEDELGRA